MDIDEQHIRFLNHIRVLQALQKSTEHLHRIFKDRWSIYQQLNKNAKEWDEEAALGLIRICPPMTSAMKDQLQTGNIALWDITLTNHAIQAVSTQIRKLGGRYALHEEAPIKVIRELRNMIAHGKPEISNDEFKSLWNQFCDVWLELGDHQDNIKEFRIQLENIGNTVAKVNNESSNFRFCELKNQANSLFRDQKFKESIDIYDQILRLPGLLPEDQALIFSNRSASYLSLNDKISFEMAKRDADFAIQFWPSWWRGYHRLGRAQIKLQQWYEAEKSFDKALILNPSAEEARDDLGIVRGEIGMLSREEHLNPIYHPITKEDLLQAEFEKHGVNEEQYDEMEKMILNSASPSIQKDLINGHKYRTGVGVPQDYRKSASFYAKAAAKGDTVAMFYLGYFSHYGQGVPQNYAEAMRWLLKVANSKPKPDNMAADAQHFIGLKYSEGTGLPKDYQKAAEWFEKGAQNGYAGSANNLGMLYKNGQGVARDYQKAFGYFKLAAQLGSTQAMQNLARCYFLGEGSGNVRPSEEDIAEGTKWLKIAADKGDLIAARELERRENFSTQDVLREAHSYIYFKDTQQKNNPLNYEQFGNAVMEAAKKGSVTAQKHLNIWRNMELASEAFKKNDPAGLVAALAKSIKLEYQLIKVPDMFKAMLKGYIEAHPNEVESAICNVHLNLKLTVMVDLVKKYLSLFPDDEYLLEMAIASAVCTEDVYSALEIAKIMRRRHPNSITALYNLATVLCLQDNSTEACIQALDAFIAVAPEDHRFIPGCHYRKAQYYSSKRNMAKFMDSFESGLAAEKKQLPCFLPYEFPCKNVMEKDYLINKQQAFGASILAINRIISDPHRKFLLCQQRQEFVSNERRGFQPFTTPQFSSNIPKPPALNTVKPITLKEMNPIVDQVYVGRLLEGRILEWSFLAPNVATVIEDKNGDCQRLTVYNWPFSGEGEAKYMEALKSFRPGVKVSIINPYMRIAACGDGQNKIRVDSADYIKLDYSMIDKECYCCGKLGETMRCAACSMVRYCSRECQRLDWEEFRHKDICALLKKYQNFV